MAFLAQAAARGLVWRALAKAQSPGCCPTRPSERGPKVGLLLLLLLLLLLRLVWLRRAPPPQPDARGRIQDRSAPHGGAAWRRTAASNVLSFPLISVSEGQPGEEPSHCASSAAVLWHSQRCVHGVLVPHGHRQHCRCELCRRRSVSPGSFDAAPPDVRAHVSLLKFPCRGQQPTPATGIASCCRCPRCRCPADMGLAGGPGAIPDDEGCRRRPRFSSRLCGGRLSLAVCRSVAQSAVQQAVVLSVCRSAAQSAVQQPLVRSAVARQDCAAPSMKPPTRCENAIQRLSRSLGESPAAAKPRLIQLLQASGNASTRRDVHEGRLRQRCIAAPRRAAAFAYRIANGHPGLRSFPPRSPNSAATLRPVLRDAEAV